MTTLTFTPEYGYISETPLELEDEIRQACSFRPAGYRYVKAYKKGKWDGWIRLLKHGKFPAGLEWRIRRILDGEGVEYDVVRETNGERPLFDRVARVLPRDYQFAAMQATMSYDRGIIRAPTGAGKTVIAGMIIAGKERWALVVVPTIDLLYQTKDVLEQMFGIEVGQLGDGVIQPAELTVATCRTAAKVVDVAYESYEFGEYDDTDETAVGHAERSKLRDWVHSVGTLIVDEAHILAAESVYNVATKIPAPFKYGMSASPWRDDNADLMLEAATGPIIYRIGTKELVEQGFLVPPVFQVVDTSSWWTPASWDKNQYAKCYSTEIVNNSRRNRYIADIVNRLDRPTMVLVKQVTHGRHFEKLIPGSVFLSGRDTSDRRNEVFEKLRTGEQRVVIATVIADLGLDLPMLSAMVLAGGGKSSVRHLQRIGRAARPYEGKKNALIIDFDDSHINKWFREHARRRREIEHAEWGEVGLWI